MSVALYIPDNERVLTVLDSLPAGLRPYRDDLALLIHFAAGRRWRRREDEKDSPARLHSLILRQYVPDRQLRPLRDHLAAQGVLICTPHSAGHFSKGYEIGPQFDGLPRRWVVSDPRLIPKLTAWKRQTIKDHSPEMRDLASRRRPVTDAMIDSLDHLKLTGSADAVERALRGQGIDPGHVSLACSVIANGDHDGVFMDDFGWRVHSIVTHTATPIRAYMTFDGRPLVGLDVRNAQPLIFAAALRNPPLCATYIAHAQHNGERSGGGEGALGVLRAVPSRVVEEFGRLCESGMFYEAMMEGSEGKDRPKIKRAVFRDVFFGRPDQRGPVSDAFQRLWPEIYDAIQRLKALYGYKIVSQILQRMESGIMIDGVCGRIVSELPGLHFATIHDAALVVADRGADVKRFIEAEFGRYGVQATVKQENLAAKGKGT